MTDPKHPDLTPSLIADRLCPPATGDIVRQLVEAIAEKAIALTPPGKTGLPPHIAVERVVCLAAQVILQRQRERLENLFMALTEDAGTNDED